MHFSLSTMYLKIRVIHIHVPLRRIIDYCEHANTEEDITIMKRYTIRENYLLHAIRYMLFNKNRDTDD